MVKEESTENVSNRQLRLGGLSFDNLEIILLICDHSHSTTTVAWCESDMAVTDEKEIGCEPDTAMQHDILLHITVSTCPSARDAFRLCESCTIRLFLCFFLVNIR